MPTRRPKKLARSRLLAERRAAARKPLGVCSKHRLAERGGYNPLLPTTRSHRTALQRSWRANSLRSIAKHSLAYRTSRSRWQRTCLPAKYRHSRHHKAPPVMKLANPPRYSLRCDRRRCRTGTDISHHCQTNMILSNGRAQRIPIPPQLANGMLCWSCLPANPHTPWRR
jgi:hypothetical protein